MQTAKLEKTHLRRPICLPLNYGTQRSEKRNAMSRSWSEVVRLRKCRRFHLRFSSRLLQSLLLFRLGFARYAIWGSISDFIWVFNFWCWGFCLGL